MIRTTCLLCLLFVIPFNASADTWPQFRGSRGDGVSNEKKLPASWSEESGVKWSVELSGQGNSSPAITARRVDLTTQMKDNSLVVASLDRKSGKVLRQTKVGKGVLDAKGPQNLYAHRHNAATSSPIADDDHIWAFFGTGLLVCLDAKSHDIVWNRNMVKEYGAYNITFGMGSSPRLYGNLLYVACMTKGASYVVALNKKTGNEVWKSNRRLPAKDDGPDAYSTPVIYEGANGPQLLVSGSDHINAYDPKSGRQLWVSSGLTIESPFGRIIASPVAYDGIVVATTGNPGGAGKGHIIAVPATRTGNVSEALLWKYAKTTPDSSTPICVNGKLYMITDNGVATCLDLRSGDVVWQKRIGQGPFHASAVSGDGKIYFQSASGGCVVVQIGESGKILGTNRLQGSFYSTPAISDGVIYLRAYERIVAVDGRQRRAQ